ncbi:DNA polymerase III subunit gamma/tau [Lactobacillus sp. DCY120]|uniref:DNA-directed DNA polymerase n=1 Tax=Bombilactobacillus apium TaxID=2675299 RepID=A0A850RAY2_9LACO|nr:DNA polymerase III subunit gamma/tau [Bombilactobacillus apium]NVY95978.1 DNA polymerase III subunit gamma/tau [Bombilactobacillus apium]
MAYQALYRVWRPQCFADIVGQEMIAQTLINAVATDQVSHAYLFTGPRGTGKTSCSKILAKAVNCLHPQAGEPCNECELCQAITAGSLNDVLEIDAASNNGVEQIRDIRDKVKYAPTRAAYKVYIIDEVHMLSTGAFNALLKTLEDPPAQVIFILATTEPQKIPATIISRTQRFDFRRISAEAIVERMEYILEEQKIQADPQGLAVIARAAEGGMRDALSILDQTLALTPGQLTLDNALQVTGSLDQRQLMAYLQSVTQAEAAPALDQLHELLDSGRSAARLTDAVIGACRDLLLAKTDPQLLQSTTLESPESEAPLLDLQNKFSNEQLYQMIEATSKTQQDLRQTNQTTIYLEVLTVQLIEIQQRTSANSVGTPAPSEVTNLEAQVAQLQEQVKTLLGQKKQPQVPTKSPAQAAARPRRQTPAKVDSILQGQTAKGSSPAKVDQTKINQILEKATRQDLQEVQNVWADLMSMLSVTQRAVMKVSKPVAASAQGVVVAFDYAVWFERVTSNQEMLTMLKTNLDRLLKSDADVVIVAAENWPQIRQDFLQHHQLKPAAKAETKKSAPDLVGQAQEMFGKELVEVKPD